MGYTPFFMVYGAEAVLPSDIRHDSPRVAAYVEADNEKARQDSLDLLDEERDLQQRVRRFINKIFDVITAAGLKLEPFKKVIWCSGSSRIRLICISYRPPPWEAPFVVSKNLHNGSYYLIDVREHEDSRQSEEETKRPWNIALLRPYYT